MIACMNKMQRALLDIQEENTSEYVRLLANRPGHRFSSAYIKRKKEIVALATKSVNINPSEFTYRRIRRLSMRTILVAALVMIMCTATVIAVAKPHLYFQIKEYFTHWDVSTDTGEESGVYDDDFKITPIKPTVPEGYEIVSEEVDVFDYRLQLKGNDNTEIEYNQSTPGASYLIDNETTDNRVVEYKGNELLIGTGEDYALYLYNNGEYLFDICAIGKVDEAIIYQILDSIPEGKF